MELQAFISEAKEPVVTQKATDRIIKILDSNYQKSDLKAVVRKATHLNPGRELCRLHFSSNIKVFWWRFRWMKVDPVDLELKEWGWTSLSVALPYPKNT